ncbi:unnamed protein product [Gulo gulo]|uniref:Uncharacterized protein n=1 Tax=Gulo gulo TaxID=48420 RepID=A0A9X9M5T4_GULGU|nr:unnamed protein product [Gulo gulo]
MSAPRTTVPVASCAVTSRAPTPVRVFKVISSTMGPVVELQMMLLKFL